MNFKRGQTFNYSGQILNNGSVMDFSGWTITSQLRDIRQKLIFTFNASFTDAATGKVEINASSEETASWPLGAVITDIRLMDPTGTVVLSDTIGFSVGEGVTNAEPV